jgi:hypothetical protein
MVLQPDVYGAVPIYSYVIHGAVGLVALMNMHRIVNWLENNSVVKKLYRKIQTFEDFINSSLKIGVPVNTHAAVKTCRSLFAR